MAEYDVESELRYIRVQMKSQPAIHGMVEHSLDKLRKLGYPLEKIKAIMDEFEKPIEERKPVEIAPPPPELMKFREDLTGEIASILQEVIPSEQDSMKAKVMAGKIVDQASLKYRPEELERVSRSAKMMAKRVSGTYRKMAGVAPPPKPPRKIPEVEALRKDVERLRKQVKRLKKKLGE